MDWEGGGTLNQGGTYRKVDLLMIIFSSRRSAPPGVTFQQRGPPDVCRLLLSVPQTRPQLWFPRNYAGSQTKCGFLHTTVPVMYVCAPQRCCSRNLVVSRTAVCCGLGREMAPRPLTNTISAKGLIKIWLLRINSIGHVCTCQNNEFNSFYLISHEI